MGGSKPLAFILFLSLILTLFVGVAEAHKTPVVEYTKLGLWETTFTYAPRQPVVGEDIRLLAGATHPDETIKGAVNATISVYKDASVNEWKGGHPYYRPNWILLKSVNADQITTWNGPPIGQLIFTTDIVMDQPGNYVVTIDWYEDGQLKGQDTHHMDVEQRTMGPLYWIFPFLIIGGVLLGARWGIL